MTQAEFGSLIGTTQQHVSALVQEGVLIPGQPVGVWLARYCGRLREQAAGRASRGELDLSQERAALARAQRRVVEIKAAAAAGEYAPIGLLADVLSRASTAVVSRFDGLMPALAKACPDLTERQRETIEAVVARGRNEWVRETSALADRWLDELVEADEEATDTADDEDGEEPMDNEAGHGGAAVDEGAKSDE